MSRTFRQTWHAENFASESCRSNLQMGEGVKNGKPWDSIASFKKRDAPVVEESSPAPSCSTLNTTVKGVADGIRTRDTQIHSLVRASTAEEGY